VNGTKTRRSPVQNTNFAAQGLIDSADLPTPNDPALIGESWSSSQQNSDSSQSGTSDAILTEGWSANPDNPQNNSNMGMDIDQNGGDDDNKYQVYNVLGRITGMLTFSYFTAMMAWKIYRRYRRRR
jgi:hypothetical protein